MVGKRKMVAATWPGDDVVQLEGESAVNLYGNNEDDGIRLVYTPYTKRRTDGLG